MTEWRLQEKLTKKWAAPGVRVDGVHCMLVAWEVMLPSWRINDSRRHWTEPSLDFLLADKDMNLVVVELKREVPGVVPVWSVLSQVTHRSLLVADTRTQDLIERAWRSCWSGQHGRLLKVDAGSLQEAHQMFFDLPATRPSSKGIRRVVAALRFGRNWAGILRAFNESSPNTLREQLEMMAGAKSASEIRRLISLPQRMFKHSMGPVSSLLIDEETGEELLSNKRMQPTSRYARGG